jgi:single-stranded-DNA-specific exonuclease
LRVDLMQSDRPHVTIPAIAFQQPQHYKWVRSGKPISVCYQIVDNHYRGTVTKQLRVKDIKPERE